MMICLIKRRLSSASLVARLGICTFAGVMSRHWYACQPIGVKVLARIIHAESEKAFILGTRIFAPKPFVSRYAGVTFMNKLC